MSFVDTDEIRKKEIESWARVRNIVEDIAKQKSDVSNQQVSTLQFEIGYATALGDLVFSHLSDDCEKCNKRH